MPFDIVHKLKCSLRELRETSVWLKIIAKKKFYDPTQIEAGLRGAKS